MTEKFNTKNNYELDHTSFGGLIYPSDYDRETTLSDMARRIAADNRFERMLMTNTTMRNRKRRNGGNNNNVLSK